MSAASPRPPASPTHATRQLLDELDALMQRMLALPVNQLEEELRAKAEEAPPPAVEPAPVPDLVPEPEASVPFVGRISDPSPLPDELEIRPTEQNAFQDSIPEDRPIPEEAEAPEPEEPPPDILPAPVLHHLEAFPAAAEEAPAESAQVKEPAPWEEDLPASPEVLAALGRPPRPESECPATPRPPSQPLSPGPRPAPTAAPPLPLFLRPLVWLNRLFDGCTGWLGPLGRWLRGAAGRNVLGWVGLGLLAGALAWVLTNEIAWTR